MTSPERQQPGAGPGREVALIGTGTMGSALARALLAGGHRLTVWNRTRSRAEPLAAAGATLAGDVLAAARAAGIVLMCVSDQAAATGLLSDEELAGQLAGRTLVQLTTGTAADGRRNAAWARSRGIGYADVAILAYPREVGGPAAEIFCCGPAAADPGVRAVLDALGTRRYLGADAGLAAVVDAALIGFFYGTMAGFLHCVALATAEGMAVADLLDLTGPFFSRFVANAVAESGDRIARRDYADPQSSMDTHLGGIDMLVLGASREAGIDVTVVTAIRDAMARVVAAGHGADDIAVMAEILRAPAGEQRPADPGGPGERPRG